MNEIVADTHNFGRSVKRNQNKIIKPRPVGLEWLFLCSESPLRSLLYLLNIKCIEHFVSLTFSDNTFLPSIVDSEVDFFELDSTQLNLTVVEYEALGSLIAFLQWFGLGDMHTDNLFFGYKNNKFICSPIDIESIFEEYKIPSQSLIIPSLLVSENECGFAKIFSKLNESDSINVSSTVVRSYIDTYTKLNDNINKIFETFETTINLDKVCSRVRLRSTSEYYNFLSGQQVLGLKTDELTQLRERDIPYFFKFLDSEDLYFWENENSFVKSSIAISDFDKLQAQLPNVSKAYIKEKYEVGLNCIGYGIVQLAKSFDLDKNRNYVSEYLDVKICYDDVTIKVTTLKGNYKCKR